MKNIFFGLLVLLSTNCAFGQNKDPRPDMQIMAKELALIQKYLLSESEFGDPKNASAIKKSLSVINGHLQHLGSTKIADDLVMKTNLTMLQQHLQDTTRAFGEVGNPYARYMLQSGLQMCIACHTRTKAAEFPSLSADEVKGDPLSKAEYFFATRQFEKGKEIYENLLQKYPKEMVGQFAVRKAMLALAVYFARVKSNPKDGASFFATVAKQANLPAHIRRQASSWADGFKHWQSDQKLSKLEGLSEKQLLDNAKKILRKDVFDLAGDSDGAFHVSRLRASVVLHQILETGKPGSKEKGEALLYLGRIYNRISSNMFFRFGEMYLKACISEYKKSPIAEQCYDTLEEIVVEGFTGSAGTDIPQDVELDLLKFKRLAY